MLCSGCFGAPFRASGAGGFLFDGYRYDGSGARALTGSFNATLDGAKNSGSVVIDVRDAIHTYHIEMGNFTATEAYQSGGVTRDADLFGGTGAGTRNLPELHVYAAAFGTVTSAVDGRGEKDPSNLFATLPAVFFVARGQYRDNETHRITASDGLSLYDPSRPDDARVAQIGAQAALLVFTARGDLYRYFEFNEVRVLAS